MCVTGLPKPQPDHAIRMVKFARDCLYKMEMLLKDLTEELGPGTETLGLRVGCHSGHVTAGVLRGDKGRFQLFGDTVNTASRMESNGEKGRIHVSQTTADELIKSGKTSWLLAREGTIAVKGKGEMQTYFLNFLSPASVVGRTRSAGTGRSGMSTISADSTDDIHVANHAANS